MNGHWQVPILTDPNIGWHLDYSSYDADDLPVLDENRLDERIGIGFPPGSVQAAEVLRDLGEGLAGYSATGELIPAAAESWEISDDGLIYTFHLREGLRWSNGDALTADHFVAGMRRLVSPATAAFYAQMIVDIENADAIITGDIPVSMLGVEAPDDRTIVLRLVQPTPYLSSLLTHPSTFPIHPASLEEHGEGFARPGKLVSNGAYALDAWIPGSLVALKRNEHYWNNAATAIDAVNYHVLVQNVSELNRYRAGELHVTSTVPPAPISLPLCIMLSCFRPIACAIRAMMSRSPSFASASHL